MSKIDPDPETQQTLDDKVIEQLKQDMGEDAVMVIESYVESIRRVPLRYRKSYCQDVER